MTNIFELQPQESGGLNSITGLTEAEYATLSAALAKIRASQNDGKDDGVHSRMRSAVRTQLQQRLKNANNLSSDEKLKLMRDISALD